VTMRLQTWRFPRAALTTRANSVECCAKDTFRGPSACGIRAMEPGFHAAETAGAVIDDASVTKAFRKVSYSIDEVGSSYSRVLARDFKRRGWRGACLGELFGEPGRRNAAVALVCQARCARLRGSPAAVSQFQHVWVFLEPLRSRPAHIVHLGTIVIGERFCDLVPQIRNSGAERADPFDEHGHDGHRDVTPANMVSAA
jgi:hypothetical protein